MIYKPGQEYYEYVGPTLVRGKGGRWITPAGPWELSVVVRCEACKGRGAEDSCHKCGNTGTREIRRNTPFGGGER